MLRKGTSSSQNRKNEIIDFVSMPWLAGMWFSKVRKLGHIAPEMIWSVHVGVT